jgi:REP element-mobilizing transposase RayT
MTSPAALEFGTYYHIFSRGNNRENVFLSEENYSHFMALFLRYISPVADLYAYCLLRNHFHLFLRIKLKKEIVGIVGANAKAVAAITAPSQRFSNLLNAYAKRMNLIHNRTGSLFQHPFHRIPVANNEYFGNLIRYIHQNPQHHGFVKDFRDWPYSSYHALHARKLEISPLPIFLAPIKPTSRQFDSILGDHDLSLMGPLVAGDYL